MADLPPGFVDLLTAQRSPPHSFVNIIGVVVDKMEPRQSRGTDLLSTFTLQDPKLWHSINGSSGLMVRFFRKTLSEHPAINGLGDLVLLRQVKITQYQGQTVALASFPTSFLVFPASTIPAPEYDIAYMGGKQKLACLGDVVNKEKLSVPEQQYLIWLSRQLADTVEEQKARHEVIANNRPPPTTSSGPRAATNDNITVQVGHPSQSRPKVPVPSMSRRFQLIKQLEHMKFADVCVEVVKKFPNQWGNCELYVTDYTENTYLHYYAPPEEASGSGRDGDEFGYIEGPKRSWPGPYEQMVLKVVASQPHASFADSSVEVGDIVLLQNVKIKMDQFGKLQGDMWQDTKYPEKILIHKIREKTTPEVQNLLLKKDQYWSARNAQIEPAPDRPAKKKKKKNKQRREAAEEATRLADEDARRSNKHVRCSTEEQPLSRIDSIVDRHGTRHMNNLPNGSSYTLPFVNANFRARVRVLDFQPDSLEDFALPLEDGDTDSPMGFPMESSPKWKWSFSLLVQDATKNPPGEDDVIWLNLGHEQTQYLFGNTMDDPRDLRLDRTLLNKLKENMCILWGDLEEVKSAGKNVEPSNLSFECCISEYGVLKDGGDKSNIQHWRRDYMMHGVTIL